MLTHASQRAISGDQGLFQRRLRPLGSATAAEMPTQQLPGVAIDDQGQSRPAVATTPNTAHVRSPPFIRNRAQRRQRLNPGPESHRTLANLPGHDLENALHGVLVHVQQVRNGAATERGILLDHRFSL